MARPTVFATGWRSAGHFTIKDDLSQIHLVKQKAKS
jgi:hypothetical protein